MARDRADGLAARARLARRARRLRRRRRLAARVRRTGALTIALLMVVAAVAAWLVAAMPVPRGRAAVVPPVALGPALVVLAVALLLVAWPVRQAARGTRRIDDRHATSVLGFAKASSHVGAILAGAALGGLAFFASRAVVVG
ncbi:DUF3180 family protein, partial [Escherichia coli]